MRSLLAILLVGWVLLAGCPVRADGIRTDVNIVTGLDVSGSIDARETQIQIDGMAMAIRSPEVINAIQNGRHGRVGFAVFVWANGNYPLFASWRLIGSPQEAVATSEEVADRLHAILGSDVAIRLGELTDLSGAIEYGAEMLAAAPYPAEHAILNIIGNGLDNVGDGPQRARDRLVARGTTINGVVVGHNRGVIGYFRSEVIGGPTAFVLAANSPDKLVEVLERKFVTEIALAARRSDADRP